MIEVAADTTDKLLLFTVVLAVTRPKIVRAVNDVTRVISLLSVEVYVTQLQLQPTNPPYL